MNVKKSIKCQPQASFQHHFSLIPSIHSFANHQKIHPFPEGSGLLSSSDDFGTGIAPGIWLHSPAFPRRNEGTTGTWKTTWFPLGKGNTSKRKTHCFRFILVLLGDAKISKIQASQNANHGFVEKISPFFGTQDSFRFIFYLGSIPRAGLYHIEFKVWYWNNWAYHGHINTNQGTMN